MIKIIAAIDEDTCIGIDNKIPWRMPSDLDFFRNSTMGHTVVMGRNTCQSIGKVLDGRKNIVVALDDNKKPDNKEELEVKLEKRFRNIMSLEKALIDALDRDRHIFIIGGSLLYRIGIKYAEEMIITHVFQKSIKKEHAKESKISLFPFIDPKIWKKNNVIMGKDNGIGYSRIIYRKKDGI